MSIAASFGHSLPRLPKDSDYPSKYRCVGIEIEQEYDDAEQYREVYTREADQYWSVTHDNSMRNVGIEFVSTILYPSDINPAMGLVWDAVMEGTFSWRAGIHVHVDVRDLTYDQLRNVANVYSIIEPLLFAWEGNHRHESRFCVPWYTCPDSVTTMFTNVTDENSPHDIADSVNVFGKYAALNLIPITGQGSIEFRHMQTCEDLSRVKSFISMCLSIVEQGKDTTDLARVLSQYGARYLLTERLGGHLSPLLDVPNYEELLWRGIDTSNALSMSKVKLAPTTLSQDSYEDLMEIINNQLKGDKK